MSGDKKQAPANGRSQVSEALAKIYKTWRRWLDSWLRRKGVPPDDRADLAQEVWTAVARRPAALLAADSPEALLRVITERRFIDYVRRRRIRRELAPAQVDTEPARSLSSKVRWKHGLDRCRRQLKSDAAKHILTLWHEQGLDPSEIAEKLNGLGLTNGRKGRFTANVVSQKIRREIIPALAQIVEPSYRG
jgi:DNA-directed RNA polymerase specialized sigma24 family protein